MQKTGTPTNLVAGDYMTIRVKEAGTGSIIDSVSNNLYVQASA